ncbi:MAG TPA: hypothetical protein VLA03_01195 [Draconibacterium sp.]|nr:hypothetical protein [Draconibacterium sp.]
MNTKTLRSLKFNLFEKKFLASRIACLIFIVAWIIYLWGGRPFVATLVSVSAISLFILQLIYQFKLINGLLGGIMFFVSIYFSLAVWSEFNDFEIVASEAWNLLLVGWGLCLTEIILSLFMIMSALREFSV